MFLCTHTHTFTSQHYPNQLSEKEKQWLFLHYVANNQWLRYNEQKKNIIKKWKEIVDRESQICLWFVFDYFSSFLLTFLLCLLVAQIITISSLISWQTVYVFVCRMYFHFHAKYVFLKSFISFKEKIMCVFGLYQNQVRLDLVLFFSIHLPFSFLFVYLSFVCK